MSRVHQTDPACRARLLFASRPSEDLTFRLQGPLWYPSYSRSISCASQRRESDRGELRYLRHVFPRRRSAARYNGTIYLNSPGNMAVTSSACAHHDSHAERYISTSVALGEARSPHTPPPTRAVLICCSLARSCFSETVLLTTKLATLAWSLTVQLEAPRCANAWLNVVHIGLAFYQ